MKKLLFTLLWATCFFISCDKDDEVKFDPNDLYGRWKIESVTAVSHQNGVKIPFEVEDYDDSMIFEFHENGKITATIESESENGNWTWSSNKDRIMVEIEKEESVEFSLVELTKTNLKIKMELEGEDEDGIPYKVDMTFHFRKL